MMVSLIKFFFKILFIVLPLSTVGNQLVSAYKVQSTSLAETNFRSENFDPMAQSSLLFIENAGQFPEGVKYQVWGGNETIWLADNAMWITFYEPDGEELLADQLFHKVIERSNNEYASTLLKGVNIRLSFMDANSEPEVQGFSPLATTVSIFKGNKADWEVDVPVFGGVRYVNLYPGLDLELHNFNNSVQPRLVCRVSDCGAALALVNLQVEGAGDVVVEDGRIMLNTQVGEFTLPLFAATDAVGEPLILEDRQPIVNDTVITMPIASQSLNKTPEQTKVFGDDPTDLLYSTYLGGSAEDNAYGITLDNAGNIYVAGLVQSADFPTTPGVFDASLDGDADGFVTKLNANGSGLVYSTFIGGASFDAIYGGSIEVDAAGNAFVAGSTDSSNFPTTTGAYDTSYNGDRDGFVLKLNSAGNALIYSTFLGTSDFDAIYGDIAIDDSGNSYVTGSTYSPNFPTTPGSFDTSFNGDRDGFVTKLNASGSALIYSTYLGGSESDSIYGGIDVNSSGNAYVTASTSSADFPTTVGAFDTSFNGVRDVFVAKLSVDGSALLYSTFLGGSDGDLVNGGGGIAVDNDGIAHVAGSTESADFPTTVGAFDITYNGNTDIYVTKVNSIGTDLVYSTYLGGTENDSVYGGITIDSSGNTYLTGLTHSVGFPVTPNAFDTSFNGMRDAFAAILDITGSSMIYGTYLGGPGGESGGGGITVDSFGNAYLTGSTQSSNFPTTPGAYDTSFNGNIDIFVAKLLTALSADFSADPTIGVSPLPVQFTNLSTGTFDSCVWDFGDGIGTSNSCGNPSYTYTLTGTYDVSLTLSGPGGVDTIVRPNLITLSDPGFANFTASPLSGSSPLTVTFQNLSTGQFDTCLWDFGDGVGTSTDCSSPVYLYTVPGAYDVTLTITGPKGTDSLTRPNFINVFEAITAEFSGTPVSGPGPLSVTFTNLSLGDFDTCLWNFGDGSMSSACFAPTHVYTAVGDYTVSLAISGSGSNSTETKVDYITVYEQVVANFSATPTSGSAPLTVSFFNLSTGDFNSCFWDYGDGETGTPCGQHTHVYDSNGTFTVSLTVSGPGGVDTLVIQGLINVGNSSFKIYLPAIVKTN